MGAAQAGGRAGGQVGAAQAGGQAGGQVGAAQAGGQAGGWAGGRSTSRWVGGWVQHKQVSWDSASNRFPAEHCQSQHPGAVVGSAASW